MNEPSPSKSPVALAIDISINLFILFLILFWCFLILAPFISLIAWGGIIAIALYPAFLKLRGMLGGRQKLALTLIVLLGGAIIIVPTWLFTASIIETGVDLRDRLEQGTLSVQPPNESVEDWPVIGEQTYALWSDASENLSAFLADYDDQVRNIARELLARIAGAGLGALQFLVSIIIAAAFMANTEKIDAAMLRLLERVAPKDAASLRQLSIATVRSITVGVLGIAVIQAFAAGLGMVLVGVPAAGVWGLIILILAIMQLPPILVLLPVSIYVFSVESTTIAVLFLIWSIIVSASDAVLKPMLLGRGVDAPMLVILLGAIGGMILSGIIGLFVGAVILGLSYKLLQMWLVPEDALGTTSGEQESEGS